MKINVKGRCIQLIADTNNEADLNHIANLTGNGVHLFKSRKQNEYFCSKYDLPELCSTLNIQTNSVDIELKRRADTQAIKTADIEDYNSGWLWPHQNLGIELAKVNKRYAFFYDTRTGKTLMSLKIMYDALKEGRAKRCLVICPSNIVQAWLGDVKHFPELKVEAYYSNDTAKYNAIHNPAHIIIWATNLVADNIELLKALKFDYCFFDESSALKNHSSKISDAALDLSGTTTYWYLLSATPAPNNESEYYTQLRTIDPYCFDPFRTHFVTKYFNNTSRDNKYERLVLRPEMRKVFMDKVERYAIYVDQTVMPTAGKQWQLFTYQLDAALIEPYNSMRTNMFTEVNGIKLTVDMAAAMRAKLNQLTSGFIMNTDIINENKDRRLLGAEKSEQAEIEVLSDYKLAKLKELLDKFPNEKVVIWANYTQEFVDIHKLLGHKCRVIRGGSTVTEKEQYIQEFKRGGLQYLVCHPLSVGMGINLIESHIAVYYSINDSYEALKQSSERICGHISIQPHKCEYYIMVAEGTVDEIIYSNVKGKKDASYGFMEHLQAEALL